MPASDYTASSGALKLKGGVTKKKKKKPKPEAVTQALEKAVISTDSTEVAENEAPKEETKQSNKTEAEIRFEENRRKRLEEKLEKEGVKTHKERVEELNKYLSKLTEHNDM
jgi:protein FAM32A